MQRLVLAILACLLPLTAQAQSLSDCAGDGPGSLANLVEPVEANTRTFANGNIRLLLLDFVEPACCWAHIAVLHPPAKDSEEEQLGLRLCTLVSSEGMSGFNGARLAEAQASYDPNRGLSILVPVGAWSPVEGYYDAEITLVVNQATGTVAVE